MSASEQRVETLHDRCLQYLLFTANQFDVSVTFIWVDFSLRREKNME